MTKITHASCFSGIGAVDLAAFQLGIRNLFNVEIDPFCRKVLDYWFPESVGYGNIKETDFSEWRGKVTILSGGFPCFVAGTPVLTSDGCKPIEEIEVGDNVLSTDGQYHEVERTMSHKCDTITHMRAQGMFEEVKCTPNHKFFVRKRQRHKVGFDFASPQYIPIAECKIGDKVGFPVHEGKDTNYTVDFWKLVGTWLADGWTDTSKRKGNHGHNHKTIICCGKKNLYRLNDTLNKAGFKYTLVEEKTAYKAVICDSFLCRFLEDFGKYAHGKHLSPLCFELDKERKEALFQGWMSDGYMEKEGGVKVTTVSPRLAIEMAQIARDVYKCPVCLNKATPRRKKCIIDGRIVNEHPQYSVSVSFSQRFGFYEDGFVWCDIKKLRKDKESTIVYNLSVKDENSYNVHGIAVHNCQPFSLAGERRGTEDNRYLWDEMLRAIREIRPAYVLGENVYGILSMVQPANEIEVGNQESLFGEGDPIYEKRQQFVTETIISDLEREGYSVQVFCIPACAVGAPHRRDRVWFIGKLAADSKGNGGRGITGGEDEPLARQDGECNAEPLVNGEVPTVPSHDTHGDGLRDGIHRGERRDNSNSIGSDEEENTQDGLFRETGCGGSDAPDTNRSGFQEAWPEFQATRASGEDKPSANTESEGRLSRGTIGDGKESDTTIWTNFRGEHCRLGKESIIAHSESWRTGRLRDESQEEGTRCSDELLGECGGLHDEGIPADYWRDFPTAQPVIRGGDDVLPEGMAFDAISYPKWRAEATKALGNSMVVALVKEILRAIIKDIEHDDEIGVTGG